jgi:putative transposase
MPARNRDHLQSTWFHVLSRGADRQDIYSLYGDHRLFEAMLGDAVERFETEVHAYALMTNHFHLLIRDPAGELSAAMQHLLSRYAKRYNYATGRSGPLFDQRFGCVAVEPDSDGSIDRHAATAARYVHRNPLAFVPSTAIGSYRFSSLGVYLQRRTAPTWLTTAVLNELIDPDNYLASVVQQTRGDLIEPQAWDGHVRVTLGDLARAVTAP